VVEGLMKVGFCLFSSGDKILYGLQSNVQSSSVFLRSYGEISVVHITPFVSTRVSYTSSSGLSSSV